MIAWTEYTTGERVRQLRGAMTQQGLADAAGVSVALIQKLEQGKNVSLPYLMKIANALGADVSVVLGEQSPRRAITLDERMTLRAISVATHEAGSGLVDDVEPGDLRDLRAAFVHVFTDYWNGVHTDLGAVLPRLLLEASAQHRAASGAQRRETGALLADAFQLAGHYANVMSARDLAYAATAYAREPIAASSDEFRAARLEALTSYVYMRDGKLNKAMMLAERSALAIEPRYSERNQIHLAVYGNLMTNAAIAASRGGGPAERTRDYLSQVHAAAARMDADIVPYGAIFGPVAALTQAVSVAIAIGDIGQAISLIGDSRLNLNAPGVLEASKSRYLLDVALIRCEQRKWDRAASAVEAAYGYAPTYTRIQALTSELITRIGQASSANVRRLAAKIGVPYISQ